MTFKGLTEIDLRFISATFLTIIFSKFCKLKNGLLPLCFSFIILLVAFGIRLTNFILWSFIFNLFLLLTFKCNEYVFTVLNFVNLYIFKIKGKVIDSRVGGTFDISGVLMLTTIKMCYIGKEYDTKKHSLKDAVGYLTFIPGLFLGPTPTFLEYVNKKESTERSVPWFYVLKSLIFLLTFKFFFNQYFPIEVLYIKGLTLPRKLINLYLFNVGRRMRFYFAWNFTNACYILQGYDNMENVNISKVEFATSIKDLSQGWNIKTNQWLKICFFDKLKHKNIFFASLMTFLVSALWHGINVGYLIMFLSFGISIPIVKCVNKLILSRVNLLFPVLSRIQMMFFVAYFSSPFFILNLKNTLRVWEGVYFYGHLYCLFCGLLFLISKRLS